MDNNTCIHNYENINLLEKIYYTNNVTIIEHTRTLRKCKKCGYIDGIGYIKKEQSNG